MDNNAKIYSYEDAFSGALLYFGGDELAARVWVDKYALKDGDGNILEDSPIKMHRRLAKELSRIEEKYANPLTEEKIFSLLDHFKYIIPAGGSMFAIGNDNQLTPLSNCYAVGSTGDADSYGAIMKTDEEIVQILKRKGGAGFDLSPFRPKGMAISSSSLTSMGIVSLMERYCHSVCEVEHKGRKGNLMLSVSVKHPDAENFVHAQSDNAILQYAKTSIKLDDAFMCAAENKEVYTQQFPVEGSPLVEKETEAYPLWKKIVQSSLSTAEPFILFWDTIRRESLPDCYAEEGFSSLSTNPSGQIPLCPYDSCRLLSMNLYSYVVNPFTPQSRFNFELFRQHVVIAQRLLDDIVDLELEKIHLIIDKIAHDPQTEEVKATEKRLWEKIAQKCQEGRRTGLGITGEGDMLAAMGLRYGSDEAVGFAVNVQRTLALAAYRSSVTLAKERGAFPVYAAQKEIGNPFIQRLHDADASLYNDMMQYGRRNIACLTIAPTGTISLMSQTSSGIEPIYKVVYPRKRQQMDAVNEEDSEVKVETYFVYHKNFEVWMKQHGYDVQKHYTDEELSAMIAHSPYADSTAQTVNGVAKVRMLGAIQKWVDHSIGVTVNLTADMTEDEMENIYFEAWKSGCKSCSVYRDSSKMDTYLVDNTVRQNTNAADTTHVTEIRPQVLECDVVRFQNKKDKWVAFVGLMDGYPYEIFTGLQDDEEGIALPKSVVKGRIIRNSNRDGSHRYDFQFENKRGYKTTVEGLSEKFNKEYWNYAKLISGVIRYRMPLERVLKLVSSLQLDDDNINTWKNGVTKALKKYVNDGTKAGGVCPNCGQETLIFQEGCIICCNCGCSECQ